MIPVDAEERLLLAVRDRPDDDGPRLRYAELIADRRPEHAQLIRLQCGDSGSTRGDADAPDTLAAAVARYLASLPEAVRDYPGEVVRGFLEPATGSWHTTGEDFLRYHEVIFQACPTVTGLGLDCSAGELAELSALPAVARYRDLNLFDSCLDTEAAGHLARSPHLGQLRFLGLSETGLDDAGLTMLLGSESFPQLAGLDLSGRPDGQYWTVDGLRPLAEARFAGSLRQLQARRRFLDDRVLPILAALPGLAELDLDGNQLSDDGLAALAGLSAPLQDLDLGSGADYGSLGLAALAGAAWLGGLERLTLAVGHRSLTGLATLLGSPMAALRYLVLDHSGFHPAPGPALGQVLAESGVAAQLFWLRTPSCGLGPHGVTWLLAGDWPNLRHLGLFSNGLGDQGAVALAGSPMPGQLQGLELSHNGITDTGARALLAAPQLRRVRLGLSGNPIDVTTKRAVAGHNRRITGARAADR